MTIEDDNTIKELRALTGLKESQISSVFMALSYMHGLGNYYNNEEITIPYFGTFRLRFEGNEGSERKANVTGFFTLHEDMKRNVGIIEDYRETNNERLLLDLDAFKHIKNETRLALKLTTEG